MAVMGMEDMVGEGMGVEGEAEAADLEVAVEEGSEGDGDGFYGDLAYLLAFRAGSWKLYYEGKQNEMNSRLFGELSTRAKPHTRNSQLSTHTPAE